MFALHHFRTLLLVIAFGLAGVLAWRLPRGEPLLPVESSRAPNFERVITPPNANALAVSRQAIADRMSGAPEFADFVARLASTYPADRNRLLDAFARRAVATRSIEGPETYVSDTLRALRRDRGITASRASPEKLARVFEAQANLLSGLAKVDKRLCVDFLLGQASPAFMDFAGRNKTLLANMAATSLDAMIDGDGQRIERDPPGDADFDQLEAALAKHGLGKPEIGALLDGRLPDPPIPEATLCDAGLVYFDVLKAMPDDARMRLYALAIQAMSKS
jgi:hypothetical protein